MITNLAAGLQKKLTHTEVFEEAKKAGPILAGLVAEVIKKIDVDRPSNVRIESGLGFGTHSVSYNMKASSPEQEVNNWVGDSVAHWDQANLGESEIEDVIWFMSEGAGKGIVEKFDLSQTRSIPL